MTTGTQRRLAAIVSADVVGYSRLMGADEAGTLAMMQHHRAELWNPTIEAFGGRVVGTAGDSILVEYASAVAAVESVIAVQRGMADRNADLPEDRRMLLRIGVNIGEVIVADDDIFGDGVNVAARLQEVAAPGGLAVSGNIHEQIAGKLEESFADDGAQEFKNIARPVQVWRWSPSALDAPAAQAVKAPPMLPDKPSIAVLPLENMSGDPEQDYFSDGVTEDIITELSRFAEFHVIARNSTAVYKGRPTDPTDVARDLGVHYVLEGSIRRAGQRIRVTAQLIDGATGNHLWAERYDREIEDIFDLQDDITRSIAGALGAKMRDISWALAIRKKPTDIDAYDLTLQAWSHLHRFTSAENLEARRLATQAKDLAPDSAEAYVLLSWTYSLEARQLWVDDVAGGFGTAHALAREAVKLDDRSYAAHQSLGFAEVYEGLHDRGLDSLRKSIELNPNFATGYANLGDALTLSGRAEEGLAEIETAIRLSPHHPAFYETARGRAQFALGRYQAAERSLVDVLKSFADTLTPRMLLAATLTAMDRPEEATIEIDKLIDVRPGFTLRDVPRSMPYKDPEDLNRLLDALRQAGLPE